MGGKFKKIKSSYKSRNEAIFQQGVSASIVLWTEIGEEKQRN